MIFLAIVKIEEFNIQAFHKFTKMILKLGDSRRVSAETVPTPHRFVFLSVNVES